ncbi:MAG TPA: hypothetical protein VN784_00940 [Candidatus Limnocylindrales bacterium]|nr:hypothetical protein [Candidatus Limnocylindrales bacterium]
MRTFIYTLAVLAALLTGCKRQPPATPLSLYIVSTEKVDGGRYIDTPAFPKLGYIAATPDLIITSLEAVGPNEAGVAGNMKPGVVVMLHQVDAEKCAALSQKAVYRKILFMVGDEPLTAPTIMVALDASQTRSLQLTVADESQQKKVIADLTMLTR